MWAKLDYEPELDQGPQPPTKRDQDNLTKIPKRNKTLSDMIEEDMAINPAKEITITEEIAQANEKMSVEILDDLTDKGEPVKKTGKQVGEGF